MEQHTKTPWKLCGQGQCPCLTISNDSQPIAKVATGEWGDSYPIIQISEGCPGSVSGELTLKAKMGFSAYGNIPPEEAKANAEFIVLACNSYAADQQKIKDLLEACQLAYRKHHQGDPDIGWDELSDRLCDTLCNVMGEDEFIKWAKLTRADQMEDMTLEQIEKAEKQ